MPINKGKINSAAKKKGEGGEKIQLHIKGANRGRKAITSNQKVNRGKYQRPKADKITPTRLFEREKRGKRVLFKF